MGRHLVPGCYCFCFRAGIWYLIAAVCGQAFSTWLLLFLFLGRHLVPGCYCFCFLGGIWYLIAAVSGQAFGTWIQLLLFLACVLIFATKPSSNKKIDVSFQMWEDFFIYMYCCQVNCKCSVSVNLRPVHIHHTLNIFLYCLYVYEYAYVCVSVCMCIWKNGDRSCTWKIYDEVWLMPDDFLLRLQPTCWKRTPTSDQTFSKYVMWPSSY